MRAFFLCLLIALLPLHAVAKPGLRPEPPGCVDGWTYWVKTDGVVNNKTLSIAGTFVQVGGNDATWGEVESDAATGAFFAWGPTAGETNIAYTGPTRHWDIEATVNGSNDTAAGQVEVGIGHSASDTVHGTSDLVAGTRTGNTVHAASAFISHYTRTNILLTSGDHISILINDAANSPDTSPVHASRQGTKLAFYGDRCPQGED